MSSYKVLTASLLLSLNISTLHAIKFETLGYKSISMGGASVASSSGSLAAYNNPALLGDTPYSVEISMGAGASEYDHGALAPIKALQDLGFTDTLDNLPKDLDNASQDDLNTLLDGSDIILNMNGNAVTLAPQAYIGAQISGFGFGLFSSTDATAVAVVPKGKDQLIVEDTKSTVTGYTKIEDDGSLTRDVYNINDYNNNSIIAAVENGDVNLNVTGYALAEIPIAYGYNFETKIGNIMVGGALKYMQAITYTDTLKIDDSGETSGSDLKKNKTSSNFGIDLGLAYQPAFSYDLTFGLVAKNLNSPEFDFVDNSNLTVDPLVRAGVAYQIFDSLEIAADIDLTSNKVLLDAVESQMIGGGINYEPFTDIFALSLRAGVMQNLHSGDKAGLIYTAGLGIGVKWFQIDLSGEMSGNSNSVENVSVPQYAKVNLALVSRW